MLLTMEVIIQMKDNSVAMELGDRVINYYEECTFLLLYCIARTSSTLFLGASTRYLLHSPELTTKVGSQFSFRVERGSGGGGAQ